MMPTPEGAVKAACLDFLNKMGDQSRWFQRSVVVAKLHGQYVRSGNNSHADIWGIWRSVHVEIETKKPGWKLGGGNYKTQKRERKQMAWLAEVRELGGIAFVVTSLDECVRNIELIAKGRGWR